MLEIVDFYKVLQVDPVAEPEVIQAAYRSLARKYHPDHAAGSEKRIVAVNAAWAVLRDPQARAAYDRSRAALAPSHPSPTSNDRGQPPGSPSRTPSGPPSGTVLDFGRYAGWSFGQIARHDPDFLEWLARTPIGRPFRPEIETLLAVRAPAPTAQTRQPGRRGPAWRR